MRRSVVSLLGLAVVLAAGAAVPVLGGVAHASATAKTYNDPWLDGDLEQMRVPEAVDILARTPQHVVVGDIDSGARLTDPDVAPHLIKMTSPYTCASVYGPGPSYGADPANGDYGCDFIGSGSEKTPSTYPDGDPTDPFGHGTGTAEIIAGVDNNGTEGAGVAPNARVLPVRACYGGITDCYDVPIVAGMTYAVDMGATVVDVPVAPGTSPALGSYVHGQATVLFVFTINQSNANSAPYTLCTDKTTYPNVLCVGSANSDDTPGTTNGDTTTDVSAPDYAGVPSASGTRSELTTTGVSAAHVSGGAALLRGVAPDLSPATIRQVLVSTSRPVSGYATANKAHGIVDLAAALRSVQQMEGLVTPAPGAGAPADSPDPFFGQTTPTPSPTPTPTPTPTPSPTMAPAVVPAVVTLTSSGTFVPLGKDVSYAGTVTRGGVGVAGASVVLSETYVDGRSGTLGAATSTAGGGFLLTSHPLYIGIVTATALGASASVPSRVIVTYRAAQAVVSGASVHVHAETRPGFVTTASRRERAQVLLVTATGRQLRILKVVSAAQRRTVRGEAQGTNSIDATFTLPRGTYHLLVRVLGTPVNTGAPSRILTVTVR